MFRKKDIIFLLVLLVLVGGAFLWKYLSLENTQATDSVRIWVDGEIFGDYSLNDPQDITVTQENGCENVVRITENGFYMLRSTCKNQLCIDQGEVTKSNYTKRHQNNHVICLPNRVDVELLLSDKPSAPAEDPGGLDPMDVPDI